MLGARERLIRIRRDIEAQTRGVLKTYGIRLGTVTQGRNRAGFRDQFKAAAAGDPILEAVAASLIAVHDVACAEPDPSLIKLIVKARRLHDKLMTENIGISDLAEFEGVHHSYVSRLIRLAFLGPEITEVILDGRQPLGFTAAKLMQVSRLPLDWRAQKQALGFS